MDFPTVSRTHAVLTRYDDGSWSVTDIGSRGAVTLNGEPVQMAAVNYGDTISLGGVDMVLAPVTQSELEEQLASRTRPAHQSSPALTLFLLTVFQLLTTLQLWMGAEAETAQTIVLSFLGLLAAGWLLFACAAPAFFFVKMLVSYPIIIIKVYFLSRQFCKYL